MALTKIHFENFIVFDNITVCPVKGINVIIGKNGTGKTQLLKAIYADTGVAEGSETAILLDCFKRGGDRTRLFVAERKRPLTIELADDVISSEHATDVIVGPKQKGDDPDSNEHLMRLTKFYGAMRVVYIPVKDMLTHAKGLPVMAEKYRDFPFDRTLTDIIQKANRWTLKEPPKIALSILPILERLMDGQVVIENEEFYIRKHDSRMVNFAVEAEGLKKIGLLWQLLMNESITENSILLWDEPEANMNPEFLPELVECLLELSRHGVQLFVSTHNYIFAKYFDVRKRKEDAVAYHALYLDHDAVQCETKEHFDDLEHNAIMTTFNKLLEEVYDLQVGE